MSDKGPAEGDSSAMVSAAEGQLASFTDQMVGSIERISLIAEKGPVTLLTALGAALIVLSMVLKIQVLGRSIGGLTTIDFIAVITAGTIFLLAGSAIRLFQYKSSLEMLRAQQEIRASLWKRTNETTEKLVTREIEAEVILPPL